MNQTVCYLLAENDEQVYYFIDKEHNNDEWEWRAREWDKNGEILVNGKPPKSSIRAEIIKNRGEGITYNEPYSKDREYLWKLIKENVTSDFSEMIELGIIVQV